MLLVAVVLAGVIWMRTLQPMSDTDREKARLQELKQQMRNAKPPSISDPNALAPDPLHERAESELNRLRGKIREQNPALGK